MVDVYPTIQYTYYWAVCSYTLVEYAVYNVRAVEEKSGYDNYNVIKHQSWIFWILNIGYTLNENPSPSLATYTAQLRQERNRNLICTNKWKLLTVDPS